MGRLMQAISLDSGQASSETDAPSASSRLLRRSKSSSILASTRSSCSLRAQEGRRTRDSQTVLQFYARPCGSTSVPKVRSLLLLHSPSADTSSSDGCSWTSYFSSTCPRRNSWRQGSSRAYRNRCDRYARRIELDPNRSASPPPSSPTALTRWLQNFEIQATRKEWEALRLLSSYVGTEVFRLGAATSPPRDSKKGRGMALSVLREVSNRNAIMIAGWQAYGCAAPFLSLSPQADTRFDTGSCTES